MLLLPNGCYSSEVSVSPTTWKSDNASISTNWFVYYRFYDPIRAKPKQVIIKSMNKFKNLEQRQKYTQKLVAQELERLKAGFNPFNK